MDRLRQLLGREKALTEVSQALQFASRRLGAATVGAMHVTCADESERECVEAFQHGFVQHMLPALKFARQSAFRLANLGGRYEWGAARLAEAHFATPETTKSFKLIVVKINSHVAYEDLERPASGFRLGTWKRYGADSACCGALHGLLSGSHDPFIEELRAAFESEAVDRVAALVDEQRVDPLYRALYAGIVSARLQARKVVLDIQDYTPLTPTYFLVLPCVTINRHERDTEIVAGIYTIDGRQGGREATYVGLGDDPAAYETRSLNRMFQVTDEHLDRERKGRDHRALVRREWQSRTADQPTEVRDERLERIRRDVAQNKHRDHRHARSLLRAALPILAEVAPIPAAVLMFADGAVGIHHTFRIHKLAREMDGTHEARRILNELPDKIDDLDNDHAEALIEMLMKECVRPEPSNRE